MYYTEGDFELIEPEPQFQDFQKCLRIKKIMGGVEGYTNCFHFVDMVFASCQKITQIGIVYLLEIEGKQQSLTGPELVRIFYVFSKVGVEVA